MLTVTPLHELPGFAAGFAAALAKCEASLYVIADADTHAPITPYAPMRGHLGIAADVRRELPGLTAMREDDVSPARRAAFAESLESQARFEADAAERAWTRVEHWRALGNETGERNALSRHERAADESDRLSDRAHRVRRAIAAGVSA